MKTFESGGALRVKPRAALKAAVMTLGLVAAVAALPPLVGIYLLIVA